MTGYTIDSVFNRNGYDECIDFIKGWCILCVVLNHCIEHMKEILFPIWGSPAVALFILIQVFHTYKKNQQTVEVNIRSIWRRILKPFLFVQCMLIPLWLLCYDMPLYEQLKLILYKGGKGPGTYYVWVYIQIAFLLPLLNSFLQKSRKHMIFFIFVCISQFSEMLFCISSCPDYVYVLLFPRYIFLIYLGYQIATKPFTISPITLSLSLLSLLSLIFFSYCNIPLAPYFYNQPNFSTCHWPSYYYVSLLLIFILRYLYRQIQNKNKIMTTILCQMGKQSYNIFLLQMFYFSVLDIFPIRNWFIVITEEWIREIVFGLFSAAICVCPILVYSNYKTSKNEK